MGSDPIQTILARLRAARETAGISPGELERTLILGPGWIERLESGESVPQVDLLIALSQAVGTDLPTLVGGVEVEDVATIRRALHAEVYDAGIRLHFPYADYDATYDLPGATMEEFEDVLTTLRDALASGAGKADAVTATFLDAASKWPQANPSDLWWFLVYRAYLDPFNHPATDARRNLDQSWKRTGGWALERVLVRHYAPALIRLGVRIFIADAAEKRRFLPDNLARRLEADKVDVLLSGAHEDDEVFFGVLHVKASFAERRTDDVPLSEALMGPGYSSIFWTMDCKSGPSARPVNRGELGAVLGDGEDARSAKRRDFEVEGSFSACFSYNSRTAPTPEGQDALARVFRADFSDPDDAFAEFVAEEWTRYRANMGTADGAASLSLDA